MTTSKRALSTEFGDRPVVKSLGSILFLLWISSTGEIRGDLRSTELFRYGCSNELGRREVTLFANGTLRLRYGLFEDPGMVLAELSPEELHQQTEQLVRLLGDELTDIAPFKERSVTGTWVETCEALVEIPGFPRRAATFGAFEVQQLWISRLIQFSDEIVHIYIEPLQDNATLSPAYTPRVGDVVRSREGVSYRIVHRTGDGKGFELQGLSSPIRLFIGVDELRAEFMFWSSVVTRPPS